MGVDDLNAYVQMATGLVEATTTKAKEVVGSLLSQGMTLSSKAVPAPQMVGQVQELADTLVTTSRDNREILVGMIRTEVDKAVGRMGFIREDELAALRRHVERVEAQVKDLRQEVTELQSRPAAPAAPVAPLPADASPAHAAHPDLSDLDPVAVVAEVADTAASSEPAAAEDAPVVKKKKKKIILDPGAGA